MAVEPSLAVVAHKTDGHTAGVQVDAPVKWGGLGVASPEVSFLFRPWLFSQGQHTTGGMLRGEASIIINALQLTVVTLRFTTAADA